MTVGTYLWPYGDLGWWGFWVTLAALVLAIPLSMLANILTPFFVNWLAKRSHVSLNNRIAKLEAQLAEFEKFPAITEAEDEILWGLKRVQIRMVGTETTIVAVVLLSVAALTDTASYKHMVLSSLAMLAIALGVVSQMWLRYGRDFRFMRSPRNRKSLQTAIADLKKIRDSWPSNSN